MKRVSLPKLLFQILFGSAASIASLGCSVFGVSGVEQSQYKVIRKADNIEIREYQPRILASTVVEGSYEEAQGKAFRILADYIFGNNKANKEVAMTSPVRQSKASSSEKVAMTAPVTVSKHPVAQGVESEASSSTTDSKGSEKVAMTSPVMQTESKLGWKMTFMMPSEYKSVSDLPVPNSEKVKFEEVPSKLVASIRFSWLTDEEKNQKYATELEKWLKKDGEYRAVSKPTYAGYDPPWTLPMFRRQEMQFEVAPIRASSEDQEAQSDSD